MDWKEIEKNRLDLSYQRNLQLLNVILILGAGSFITYLAALTLDLSNFFPYTLILFVIFFTTFILYRKVDSTLRNISHEIRSLR